jgi:hypothetical protein
MAGRFHGGGGDDLWCGGFSRGRWLPVIIGVNYDGPTVIMLLIAALTFVASRGM